MHVWNKKDKKWLDLYYKLTDINKSRRVIMKQASSSCAKGCKCRAWEWDKSRRFKQ